MVRVAGRQSVKGECREWASRGARSRSVCRREVGAARGHVRTSQASSRGRRGRGITDCCRKSYILALAREEWRATSSDSVVVKCLCVCACVVVHSVRSSACPGTFKDGLVLKGCVSWCGLVRM